MDDKRRFSAFINSVCDKIMFKRVRADIEDELYDHLMCQYDKNIACGMSEDEAMKEAERLMGNTKELKYKLSAIHSYYPSLNAKKAIGMLTWGYFAYAVGFSVALLFTVNYLYSIGNILTLCAMYCLRTANKTLKAGFVISLLNFISYLLFVSYEQIYYTDIKLIIIFRVITLVLIIIQTVLVATGISFLTKPYKDEYSKRMKFLRNTVLYIATISTYCITSIYHTVAPTSFIGIGSLVIFEGPFLNLLRDSSTLLYNSDHEYNIESSPVKKTAIIVCTLILSVASFVGISYYINASPPKTVETVIDDVQLSNEEYERITANLKSYNIPQNVIDNLPASEIEKYKDSINFIDLTESAKKSVEAFGKSKNELNHKTFKNKNFEYSSSFWPIGMRDNKGKCYFRAVFYIRYPEHLDKEYKDALILNSGHRNHRVPLNLSTDYNGDFLKLFDDSGKEYKPLAILKSYESPKEKYSFAEHIDAVEFKAVENLNIYYAITFDELDFWEDEDTEYTENGVYYSDYSYFDENGVFTDDIAEIFYHSLYHRLTPISLIYSNALQLLINDREKALEYLCFYESRNEQPLVYPKIKYNYYLSKQS